MLGVTAPRVAIAGLVAILLVFFPSVIELAQRWNEGSHTYSHGWLLALLCAGLMWRRWPVLREASRPEWFWLLPLLGGSLVWMLGKATDVAVIQFAVLPAMLWCWLALCCGWRRARSCWFPLALLYLAIPIWEGLMEPLQTLTVTITRTLLALGNIPAYVDGYYIQVPAGGFVVEGGCSGLNYLLVGLTIGLLYAHLYLTRPVARAVLIAAAIATALLSNWIRVTALVLIGYFTEMRSSIVYDHETFGWVVFAGAEILFLVFAWWLEHRRPQLRPAVTPSQPPVENPAQIPVLSPVPWPMVAAGLLMVAFGPLLLQAAELRAGAASPPVQLALGHDVEPDWLPLYGGYDEQTSVRVSVAGQPLLVSVLSWREQHQGKEMIYYRNRIARADAVRSERPVTVADVPLRRTLLHDGAKGRVVWWFYVIDATPVSDARWAKLLQARALFNGQRVAHLAVVSVACRAPSCDQVAATVEASLPGVLTPLLTALSAR